MFWFNLKKRVKRLEEENELRKLQEEFKELWLNIDLWMWWHRITNWTKHVASVYNKDIKSRLYWYKAWLETSKLKISL